MERVEKGRDPAWACEPPFQVVIVGRDAACWLSAVAILKAFRHISLEVTVVELPMRLGPNDTFTGLPPLSAFHDLLDIDETKLLRHAAGTFSLGRQFVGFSRVKDFFLPFGQHGGKIRDLPFAGVWLRARSEGLQVAYEDFSLAAAAAKYGRFSRGEDEAAQAQACAYGYHLDALQYIKSLKVLAVSSGANVVTAMSIASEVSDDSKTLVAIDLPNGQRISGDLYIDATGQDALLIGEALGSQYISWQDWFPINQTLSFSGAKLAQLPPWPEYGLLREGCLLSVPLQSRTGLKFGFDDRQTSPDVAFARVAQWSGRALGPQPMLASRRPGRREAMWVGNCVAIGESAAVFDVVESVDLHAIQLGIAHLLELFPCNTSSVPESTEYNRVIGQYFDRARDFQIAHYYLSPLQGEGIWAMVDWTELPPELNHRLDTFKASGNIVVYDHDIFDEDAWRASFIGHGVQPDRYPLFAASIASHEIIEIMRQQLSSIATTVKGMSTHDIFIEMNCELKRFPKSVTHFLDQKARKDKKLERRSDAIRPE